MYSTAQIDLSLKPSHPRVPPEWSYCQQAQCGPWFTVKHSKAGLQTSSHPQNSASYLFGLQCLQQTPAPRIYYLPYNGYHWGNSLCSFQHSSHRVIDQKASQLISDFRNMLNHQGYKKYSISDKLLHTWKQQKRFDNLIDLKFFHNEIKTTSRWYNS